LLVLTSSPDESFDIPHPIARAPAHRVGAALTTYRDAAAASRTATTAMERLAATVGAPSLLLTAARNTVAADHTDAQHAAGTGDPETAVPGSETQSACRGTGQLACRVVSEQDKPRRGSAASRGEERGVLDPGQERPHLLKQWARELSRPDATARTSNVPAASQLPGATLRSPTAARTKERELEP